VADPRLGRGEAGWGIAQSGIDLDQHTLQICDQFHYSKTQYLEAFVGKAIVAPSVTPLPHPPPPKSAVADLGNFIWPISGKPEIGAAPSPQAGRDCTELCPLGVGLLSRA
jgi:hypothetical protein